LAREATTFAVALVILALVGWRRVSARFALVVVIAFIASSLRAEIALERARATYERGRSSVFPPVSCDLVGEVVGSPTVREGRTSAVIAVSYGSCADRPWSGGDRVLVNQLPRDVVRGDTLRVRADAALVQRFANAGAGEKLAYVARTGVAVSARARSVERIGAGSSAGSFIDRARAHVRDRIDATYHPDAAALGRALVLGETDLDREVDEAFRATGLSHLLAVSGTHLVIAVLGLCRVLRALLLRFDRLAQRVEVGRIAAAAAAPLAWAYADFAGGSGSVIRAASMVTAASLAHALARRPSPSRCFGASLLAGAALDPLAMLDISFTLSTAATLGLMTLSRPLGRVLGAETPEGCGLIRRAWAWIASAIATTLGATCACAPVVACLSPSLPVAGVLANVVAAPVGEAFALPFSLLHAVVAAAPPVEQGAAFVTSGALRGVLAVARIAHGASLTLPATSPTRDQLALVAAGAFVLAAAPAVRTRLLTGAACAVILAALEVAAVRAGRPTGVLRVSVLDVGQGDSILVDLPDGSLMMIDGGGIPASTFDMGARVLWPVLRARRRARVDVLVVSHPHPDHFGGLGAVVEKADIGVVWDTGEAERGGHASPGMRSVLDGARARGAAVLGPSALCGAPRDFGGAVVEVLAPCPEADEDLSTNDASFVIRIRYGRRAVLLTGDVEHEGEKRLLERERTRLEADVLKVAHHGSRTSSGEAFVAAVRPRHAVVSSGVRNRFGHPSPTTLATLDRHGATVRRTDLGGEWRYTTDGEREWTSW
jgi:competence protein ComEC